MNSCFDYLRTLPAYVSALCCATLATVVSAAPVDGVRCPNGFETHFDAARRTMRCERSTPSYRPTVCDPSTPEHVVYRVVRGRDFCVRPVDSALAASATSETDARRRPVVCVGDDSDGLKWQIDVDASAGERDRCRALRVEWIYPSQQ